jgi:DNA-binding MurR/RpiR family transcriptional regulator
MMASTQTDTTPMEDPIHRLQSMERFSSNALEKLARFTMENREAIPSMAIAEFAHEAKVSQTTVVRLCKELGYAGYREFRIAMAESRGHRRGADLLGIDMPAYTGSSTEIGTIAKHVIRINADILSDTFDLLDFAVIEQAIDLILSSSHVHMIGFGSSAPVALDVYQRFLRLGIPSSFHSDPHVVAIISANAPRGSMFFGISYSGTTRDIVECLETVRERRLRSLILTSVSASPAARAADVALISALRGSQLAAETISSRISQLAIIDILFAGLAMRHPWKPELVEALERELKKKRMDPQGA